MGICPSLSPQERAIKSGNQNLKKLLLVQLKDLYMYNFSSKLRAIIPEMPSRYLLNEGVIEDIDKLNVIAINNQSIKTQTFDVDNLVQDIRNSCLIMEDQIMNQKKDLEKPEDVYSSFQKNLAQHESLVVQMNIIYQQDFQIEKYNKSLRFFLKWSTVFQQHYYGGFLKPIYRQFCQSLYQLPVDQCDTIADQVSVFVQYMVTAYTSIYHIRDLMQSDNGDLFKNQNVYNLIMSLMFRRTKIKKFVRKMIETKEGQKIVRLKQKMKLFKNQNLLYFGVSQEFTLYGKIIEDQQNKQVHEQPLRDSMSDSQIIIIRKTHPYYSCHKLLNDLCQPSQTPITKLKIIVQISKKIMKQIYEFYDSQHDSLQNQKGSKQQKVKNNKKMPDLDPDNLTSIIMYLICRYANYTIYEELKIVQYFTTTNCLNCISGFYLNTFSAAIESILEMKGSQVKTQQS